LFDRGGNQLFLVPFDEVATGIHPGGNKEVASAVLDAAADRFFRAFYNQNVAPDDDSLLALLNALHSFNDKLRKAMKRDLFGSDNFQALRALRNLFHHEEELVHEVRIVNAGELPIVTDLMFLCLVERSLVENALERQPKERERIVRVLKWHGAVVNIQPCVFNAAVDVFEELPISSIAPSSEAYRLFENSYRFEEEHGYSHRIAGDIRCHAGDVNEILAKVFGPPVPDA
jgi:hypothetical protein